MSEGAAGAIYSVDSSILMDWQARYYPADIFKSLLQRVDALIASERFLVPALVREEVKAVGTADLIGWTDARPGIFVPTADLLAEALAIQNQFTGLRDPRTRSAAFCRSLRPPLGSGRYARILTGRSSHSHSIEACCASFVISTSTGPGRPDFAR